MTQPVPFTPGQAYQYNGQVIPSQQTLAPASAPDIAFRPACSQLAEVVQADGTTAYTLNLRGSEVRSLATFPTASLASRQAAEFELDAMGVCKIGGEVVPIVPLDSLPTPALARPEVAAVQGAAAALPSSTEIGPNGGLVLGGALLIVASLAGFAWLVLSWNQKQKSQPKAKSGQPSALEQLAALAKESPDER